MNVLLLRRFLAAALSSLVLMASGSAHALFRAYLSISGNDANPCTLQAPCRLLPAALAAADADGEVWMLDSGNYNTGPVAITKSVTILAVPGELGSVVGNGGNAIEIATAGVEVTLQNLNIRYLSGSGTYGVYVYNAKQVSMINCNVFGFLPGGGVGIAVTSGPNQPRVNVVRSVVRNNGHGIFASGGSRVTVSKTQVLGNEGYGIAAYADLGVATVHVSDTVSSGNVWGYAVIGSTGAIAARMFVTRSAATENSDAGFLMSNGTTGYLVVGGSLATNNGRGFYNNGDAGTFQSRGDNTLTANPSGNVTGTVTLHAGL